MEARKVELTALPADVPDDIPDLLPSASAIYGKKVSKLTEALNKPEERAQASEVLRMLIEKIVLSPGPNRGEIDALLYGELSTILNWVDRQAIAKAVKTKTPAANATVVSLSVVAGARSHRYRHSLLVPV